MDFIRLALADVRRNSTRTGVAVFAMALAAFAIILTRLMPEGYTIGEALAERAYSSADIIIFPAMAPVSHGSSSRVAYYPWAGADWQSHFLYYFPDAPRTGLIGQQGALPWRAMNVGEIETKLSRISGIAAVTAYKAVPCLAVVEGKEVPSILRRADFKGNDAGLAAFVSEGIVPADDLDTASAVIPGTDRALSEIVLGTNFKVRVPGISIAENGAVSDLAVLWDKTETFTLKAVGSYRIKVGETIDPEASLNSPNGPVVIPVYWKRPEILVPPAVFDSIIGTASNGALNASDLPSYQVGVRLEKISQGKKVALEIQRALGPNYGVHAIPELVKAAMMGSSRSFVGQDFKKPFTMLAFGVAVSILGGNVYVLLAQQRRKLGLLRAVGATSRDIVAYVLTMVLYVAVCGASLGFAAGELIHLLTLAGSDGGFSVFAREVLGNLAVVFGLSFGLSAPLGLLIGKAASRTTTAEVLARE